MAAQGAHSDISAITGFVYKLYALPAEFDNDIDPVLRASGERIATNARQLIKSQLSAKTSLPWYVASITSDVIRVGLEKTVEVGPDFAISGLGAGIELGSMHHPPMPHLFPAFMEEENHNVAALDQRLWNDMLKM